MAEKSTLVDDLPPVAKSGNDNTSPSVTVVMPDNIDKQIKELGGETTASTEVPSDLTITGFQRATYFSFLGDSIIWGLVGMFFIAKAFKDKQTVQFATMAAYGGLLVAIGLMFFIYSKQFGGFLNGVGSEPSLALRGFGWMIFAPALFYVLSRAVRVPAQDKTLYLAMFGLAAGSFLFIGLSQLVSGQLEQIGLSVFPILFSASLALLLFMTLTSGTAGIRGGAKRGITVIAYSIMVGWLLYPILNLVSLMGDNPTLYNFLLNIVDLAVLGCVTYGLWETVTSRRDRIALKPSFRNRKGGGGKKYAGAPQPTAGATPRVGTVEGDGERKPGFKRPGAYSNN
ncbi:MAG: hypothetical protein AAFX93_14215 [Verrucomicrobiota bacterium]